MSMYRARSGVYRSKDPTPPLPECLQAARQAIFYQYSVRAEKGDEISLARADRAHAFMRGIRDWLEKPDNDATKLAGLLDLSGIVRPEAWIAEAPVSLRAAAAYWIEANSHAALKDTDRAWAALLQCHFYLGMASGPESLKERSSRGGQARNKPFDEMRLKLIGWLGELPEKSLDSIASAIEAVTPKASAFAVEQERKPGIKARIGHGNNENIGRLFTKWSQSDRSVREAFMRVLKSPIKRGRPPEKRARLNT